MAEDTPVNALRESIQRMKRQANTAREEAGSYRRLSDSELERAIGLEHRILAFDEALSLLTPGVK